MSQDSHEIEIRTLVEAWARAVREKDMDGVLAHHTDDISMYDVPAPLQSEGIPAYKKTWELFFSESPGGAGAFDVIELKVVASDSVAFCHGLVKILESTVRLTMGLRRVRGQWLIAHEHHSYPLELSDDQ
jgi:ketosteroid isomerase-like protein